MRQNSNIQVVYDISLLGLQWVHASGKTGIFRATEELARALTTRGDIELTLTGLCGADPAAASVFSALYVEDCAERGWEYRYHPLLSSRLGL